MPQLNPGVFPMQLFWLAIAFGFLLILMAKVALPRLARILDDRSQRIDGDIAAAKAAQAEAEALGVTVESHLNAARIAAATQLKGVEEAVLTEARQRETALTESLATEAAVAEARILAAKTAAMANIQTVVAEIAQAAATKLLKMPVSEAQARATVADQTERGRA